MRRVVSLAGDMIQGSCLLTRAGVPAHLCGSQEGPCSKLLDGRTNVGDMIIQARRTEGLLCYCERCNGARARALARIYKVPRSSHDEQESSSAVRKMWSSIPLLVLSLLPAASAASAARCKAFPNTSSWPAASRWSALNSAVSGRLETVRPPAAVCYETFDGVPSYDAAKCQAYTAGFYDTDVHLASPVSIYWDFWTNRTCVPTDDPTSGECTRGAFPNYVIKAQSVKDVQAGVNFAKKNNVRL